MQKYCEILLKVSSGIHSNMDILEKLGILSGAVWAMH
jgi:hypothetical protein